MLFKLSLRNVKRSFKDYAIYFTTLILAVSVFYIFNTLSSNEFLETVFLPGSSTSELTQIMGALSVFVSIILAFLIVYANHFILKRRMKELGIYLTLGMERRDIMKMLWGETLLIGLASLAVGIGLGIPLSQVFATFLFDFVGVYLEQLTFVFSATVFWQTVLNFGTIFLTVIFLNSINVRRFKIIDLIYGKQKQPMKNASIWVSLGSALVALATLWYAYGQVLQPGAVFTLFDHGYVPLLRVFAAGFVGTFAIFLSLAGLIIFFMGKSKSYFRHLNMFTMRQLSRRIHLNWLSLSMICLMIMLSISSLAAGRTLEVFMANEQGFTAPFDVSLSVWLFPEVELDLDLSELTDEVVTLQQFGMPIGLNEVVSLGGNWAGVVLNAFSYEEAGPILARQGLHLDIAENEAVLLINNPEADVLPDILVDTITIDGMEFDLVPFILEDSDTGLFTSMLWVSSRYVLIFNNEEVFASEEVWESFKILNFDYRGPLREFEPIVGDTLERLMQPYFDNNIIAGAQWDSRSRLVQESSFLSLIWMFISFYLGIIFLLVSMSVLALQQLIDVVDSEKRYLILEKMGAESSMLKRSLLSQVAVYFLIPLLVGSLHSVVALRFLYQTLAEETTRGFDNIGIVVTSFAFVLVIYVVYFGVTYWQGKRMLFKG